MVFKQDIDELFSWIYNTVLNILNNEDNKTDIALESTDIVNRMKDYVCNNIGEQINLDNIAKELYYNPSYLSRIFKKTEGILFSEYVKEKRINEAKKLLLTTDLAVSEITKRIGYKDYPYFVGIFKDMVQMTPSNFRKSDGKF